MQENNRKDNNKEINPFFKYAGLGFQLMATICAGVWIGLQIDKYMTNKQPWGAIVCSLLFMAGGMYAFIKSLPKL
jgi:F0F1-type ATP synthase assembly protein I